MAFKNLRAYLKNQPTVGSDHHQRIKTLERIIDVNINNPFLFVRALRHRSSLKDDHGTFTESYERLEFLGDAILDLIVSEIIFDQFPHKNEGFLTKLRSKLVKGEALAGYAQQLGMSEVIIIGEAAKGQGIEFSKSALADVFEALVGALYIDKEYVATARFVEEVLEKYADFDQLIRSLDNYKSLLLEYAQAHQMAIPRYEVVSESGPDHNKTFESVVIVDEKKRGKGVGKSKQKSEQQAAKKTLNQFKS